VSGQLELPGERGILPAENNETAMTVPTNASQRQIIGVLVFVLGALCLLINLAGVTRVVYDVVVLGAANSLLIKVIILALVFAIGMGLGSLSQRRFGSAGFPRFARVFAWAYLLVAWVTYLGVTLIVNQQTYSVLQYVYLLFILAVVMGTVLSLRLVVPGRTIGLAAIPMLMIVLFHLLAVVYRYVFAALPVTSGVFGDLFLLLVMTIVSTAMLGENAFRALLDRIIEKAS
jgi:hypothetical protein